MIENDEEDDDWRIPRMFGEKNAPSIKISRPHIEIGKTDLHPTLINEFVTGASLMFACARMWFGSGEEIKAYLGIGEVGIGEVGPMFCVPLGGYRLYPDEEAIKITGKRVETHVNCLELFDSWILTLYCPELSPKKSQILLVLMSWHMGLIEKSDMLQRLGRVPKEINEIIVLFDKRTFSTDGLFRPREE